MFEVAGYYFEKEEDAKIAQKEVEGVKYIRSNTDMNNVKLVMKLYLQMMEQGVFVSPVGMQFLKEVREILLQSGEIPAEEIPEVPAPVVVAATQSQLQAAVQKERELHFKVETNDGIQKSMGAEKKQQVDRNRSQNDNNLDVILSEAEEEYIQKERDAKRRAEEKKSQARQLELTYRKRFHVATFFAAVFLVIIIGMFGITYLNGNSVTIYNYEQKIVEKYETWEKDLNERENKLKEREAKLKEQEEHAEKKETTTISE